MDKSAKQDLRIGLFGGSFDPVHLGHIEIALKAKRLFNLDELHFILAKASPFKYQKEKNSAQRLEILEAALQPYQQENFKINVLELNREAPSYSYQTVEEMKLLYPTAKLFWIMGADCFSELPKWKNLDYLADNLEFIVFRRKGTDLNKLNKSNLDKKLKVNFVDNPYVNVSSTEIRSLILDSNNTNDLDDKISNPTKGLIIKNYRNLFRE